MYTPSLADARRLAGQSALLPIYREILADLETPVSAYLKVAHGRRGFLLESVEGGEHLARYSFIGADPSAVLTLSEHTATLEDEAGRRSFAFSDPLQLIDDLVGRRQVVPVPNLPRFLGGAVGYLSYEIVRFFERLPAPDADPLGLPLALLARYDTLLVFDHLKHTIKVVSHVPLDADVDAAYAAAAARIDACVERLGAAPAPLAAPHTLAPALDAEPRSNMTRERFEANVVRAKEYIRAGDVIQVVLSQRFSAPCSAEPFQIYRALRVINPSPYMYFLECGDHHIIGASPELLVLVEGGRVSTHPIAGTRRRGADPEEDAALAAELLADEKERAEHIMLVDLGRNDIGRVAAPGTVRVTQLMEIEKYSHVMHIVSHVQGELRRDLRPLEALRACFPAGTVSGAPKIRAMEIIAELEPDRRGPYAGAVGFFGYDGSLETAITIRTIVLQDGIAHVQAGAGIVADSQPDREYAETVNKARALLRAVQVAGEIPPSGVADRRPVSTEVRA